MKFVFLMLMLATAGGADLTREEVRAIGGQIKQLAREQEASLQNARRQINRLTVRLDAQGDALESANAAVERHKQEAAKLTEMFEGSERRRAELEKKSLEQAAEIKTLAASNRKLRTYIAGFVALLVFLAIKSIVDKFGLVLPFWWRWLIPAAGAGAVFTIIFLIL
ncbi:MAG TPA: hypothetical protein VNQ90_15670 [Chthoniobacteraceae bacterium]|nr:hypothetical protein [Chthoniobacteraceae bacterium]